METSESSSAVIGKESRWAVLPPRYLESVRMQKLAETLRHEKQCLDVFTEFIGDVLLRDITPERADAWKIFLGTRYAPNSIRVRITIIKTALEYAVRIGALERNPFDYVKLPSVTFAGRILTDAELALILGRLPLHIRKIAKLALSLIHI